MNRFFTSTLAGTLLLLTGTPFFALAVDAIDSSGTQSPVLGSSVTESITTFGSAQQNTDFDDAASDLAESVGWHTKYLLDAGRECESIGVLSTLKDGAQHGGYFGSERIRTENTQLYNTKNCNDVIASANALRAQTGTCGSFLFDAGCHLDKWWSGVIESMGDLLWWALSQLTWILFWLTRFLLFLAILIFDAAMTYLVFDMGTLMNIDGVRVAWAALRDLANIFFIGGFIMVGFSTILQVANYAADKLLAKLIISALLVNFSFFFTGAVIDASNYLATEVYKGSTTQNFCRDVKDAEGKPVDTTIGNLPTTLSNAVDSLDTELCSATKGLLAKLKIGTWADVKLRAQETTASGDSTRKAIVIIGLMGSIFALMLGFVLFSAAILLIGRFVVLTMLLIVSPIGVAGNGLPYIGGWAKQWQEALLSQALFAPVFFVLFALALTLIDGVATVFDTGESYANVTSENIASAQGVIPLMIYFAISIGFLYAALAVSRKLTESGKGLGLGIDKVYGKLNEKLGGIYGNTYQATIGGRLQWAQEKVSNSFDRSLGKIPILGPTIGQALKPGKSAKPFGATKTVDEIQKATKEYKQNRDNMAPLNIPFFGKKKEETEKYREIQRKTPDQMKEMSRKEIMENLKYFSGDQKKWLAQNNKKLSSADREKLATAHLDAKELEVLKNIDTVGMDKIAGVLENMSETDLQILLSERKDLRTNQKLLVALDRQKFKALTDDRTLYKDEMRADAKEKRKVFLENDMLSKEDRVVALGKLEKTELASLSLKAVTQSKDALRSSQTKHIFAEGSGPVQDFIRNDTKLKQHLVGPGDHSEAIADTLSRIETALKTSPPQTPPQPPQQQPPQNP